MVAIIDYDAGNTKSVEKALQYLGEETIITRDREILLAAERVILPGVGSFGAAMDKLKEYQLVDVIYEVINKKIPFLGICLGMQLLFESSEESIGVSGLAIFKGEVKRFPQVENIKIPQIGWNDLIFQKETHLFEGLDKESYVYFVHSYYVEAMDKSIVAAKSHYGIDFDCAVEDGKVFACQFHPEKSSEVGLNILRNFIKVK